MLPALLPFFLLDFASAYQWHFSSDPTQCQDLTVVISGDDGKGPYRVLTVPFGAAPFSNNTEPRVLKDIPFPSDSATEVTFPMEYPENSQFVTVVSDANGFGTGGTSVAAIVRTSDNRGCYDASHDVKPQFYYNIQPSNQIVQCQSTRIWWTPADVEGSPNFLGVIPGGQSFTIPQNDMTQVEGQGTGFSWTPNIRGGTTLLIVGGDDRGNGTAGSALYVVSSGDNSCLGEDSPSSTPGTPAGGSYATSTSGAGTGGDNGGGGSSGSNGGSSTNVGAIVGGVVGGVIALIALALLLLFLRRRNRLQQRQGEKPVDLLHTDEGDERPTRQTELPQYYEPEPFIVPDPTVASDSGRGSNDGRPASQVLSDGTNPHDGMSTNGGRKGPMRHLRPVNIIQHDDAGPSEAPQSDGDEHETVELPPAYTNIRK